MSIKKGKHLQFYIDCMNNGGKMPVIQKSIYKGGLCSMADGGLISQEIFELFSYGQPSVLYWASDSEWYNYNKHGFTELRQTIVLLMAAINNEL